ncbi:DUF2079 domain-containing protein [Kamptonema sp. UHCC 0994]|uniref:DUF2079 domain-containing protein n=1 Tax=Kamptonema sp. UHCC 0994 TaxID=3031329 RepID=UPI0023BAC317|nr:DUF2079 domain-containing protein [Kamptonema sp. UHCC 0994]MDF0556334.1 DUF2079 domain-containing protein [Kamptonema sp. UHCC 0994]
MLSGQLVQAFMQNPPENLGTSSEDSSSKSEKIEVSHLLPPPAAVWAIASSVLILFLCSSLRHALFQSTGFDLGIYDQVVYLISQGLPPISSFLGFHHLGNHAAWDIYPLALLYKIYPTVYWLLLVQAIALTLGVLPIWILSRLAGLKENQAIAMSAAYLLYPVIFNTNLFDFHPEVMALPAILGAILAAKLNKPLWFCAAILWVLGGKAVLSLTVIAMGFWLLLFEKRRLCGSIALIIGVAWFLIATQQLIPYYSGSEAAGVWRYTYLGNSVREIILNLLLKPQLILGKIFSLDTIKYLFLLILPLIWLLLPFPDKKLGWRYLTPLVCTVPTLAVNILSDVPFQRSMAYHYSLPVIPFLLLAAIAKEEISKQKFTTDATNSLLVNNNDNLAVKSARQNQKLEINLLKLRLPIPQLEFPKTIIIWSLIIFLVIGESKDFLLYLTRLDTWQASRQAVAQVQPQGSVLTDNRLAPHFTHRPVVKLLSQISQNADLAEFKYVVLNLRHPWPDTKDIGASLTTQLKNSPNFKLSYQRDDVFVFTKN